MKTAKQWFLEILPIEKSSLAINNTGEDRLKLTYENFCEALVSSFIWIKSPQGQEYWQNVYKEKQTNANTKIN